MVLPVAIDYTIMFILLVATKSFIIIYKDHFLTVCIFGDEGWLEFLDLWSGQKHWMILIFNPCGEFRWSPEGPVSNDITCWRQWVFDACIYATPGLGFDSCCLQAGSAHPHGIMQRHCQLDKLTLLTSPGLFSDLLRSVQMIKREWGAESYGKLPHLIIPSKTATLVPEFAVEYLPFDRTTTLVSAFAMKDIPLGRTRSWCWWWWWWFKIKSVALQLRRAKTDWNGCCQMAVQGALWLAKR